MRKTIHRAIFAAALLAAGGAQALTIGEISVKTALGQRFSADIPVTLAKGEDITPACVRLDDIATSPYKNVPSLARYTMTIERKGEHATINISTDEGLSEPVIRIGLLIRCGAAVSTEREFVVSQTLPNTVRK
jgi:pilus assembly protein FimV